MKTFVSCLAVGLLGAISCGGGDGDGGKCSDFEACGGEVIGEWKIKKPCDLNAAVAGVDLEFDLCPTATVDASGLTVSGMTTYGADKTFSSTYQLGGTVAVTLPRECLNIAGGITATCAQVQQGINMALAADPDTQGITVTCQGSSSCVCTAPVPSQPPETESGTWSTSGTSLTTTSDGASETSQYCVSGKSLRIRQEIEIPMGMMGTMTVPYLLLEKK